MPTFHVRAVVLKVDKYNANGRKYPREIVERVCADFEATPCPLLIVSEINEWGGPRVNLNKTAGEVRRLYVDADGRFWVEGVIFGDMSPLQGKPVPACMRLISKFYLTTVGQGSVDENEVVSADYRLDALLIVTESSDADATKMEIFLIE